jgi:hypothetical protein
LHPCIVVQSEKIVVDGVILKSESDYIMDYGADILTIKMKALIKETSALDAPCDYSMFGTQQS